jgi:beta-mannosidase
LVSKSFCQCWLRLPDRLAAALGLPPHALTVDASMVTLIPGEARTFRVTSRTGHRCVKRRSRPPPLRWRSVLRASW